MWARTRGHDAGGELDEQAAAAQHAQPRDQAAALARARGRRLLLLRLQGPRIGFEYGLAIETRLLRLPARAAAACAAGFVCRVLSRV